MDSPLLDTPNNSTTPAVSTANDANYRIIKPTTGWLGIDLSQLWQYRELCWTFATRDIRLRYRQTILGIVWVLLQPLLASGVFTFIFNKVAQLPTEGIPAFLFTFAGMMGWNIFSATLNKANGSIVSNSGLVSKVFFPRLLLPFSGAISSLVDFAITFCALVCLLFIYHLTPSIGILLLPVWLFFFILLALGIGSAAGALMVYYRDMGHIMPVFTSLLLYASPIAFSLSGVLQYVDPRLHFFFYLNPLVGLLEAVRWSVFGTTHVSWDLVAYSCIVSITIFVMGILFFHRLERRFADVI